MGLIGTLGTTQAIYGSSAPTNDVGADGDIYVQSSDARVSQIWKKENGSWNAIGATTNVTSGTATPNNANGNQGDVYLKVDANGVVLKTYQKLSGSWVDIGTVIDNTAWSAFTPTFTSQTGTLTTKSSSGHYKIIGSICYFYAVGNITTNGTGSGSLLLGLPVQNAQLTTFAGYGWDAVTQYGIISSVNSGVQTVSIWKYDGSYPGADGAHVLLSGSFEKL